MSGLSDYDDLDATALANLVRHGDATPLELVDAAIARIEQRDPPLNAVVLGSAKADVWSKLNVRLLAATPPPALFISRTALPPLLVGPTSNMATSLG